MRNWFPLALLLGFSAAMLWAANFGTLPPADFTFTNGTEVKSIDPAIITGQPEGRVSNALFEGLQGTDPKTAKAVPGVAETVDVSQDGKTYTFHFRSNAVWSNGEPVTADDFVWSWRRVFHPETASQYANLCYAIVGAQKFNTNAIEPGDPVEIERQDRADPVQLFPGGTKVLGVLRGVEVLGEAPKNDKEKDKRVKVYAVEVDGRVEKYRTWDAPPNDKAKNELSAKRVQHVLLDFSAVGVKALNPQTLEVKLNNPTPYFRELTAFYTMAPVNRRCVEKYGTPHWTLAENLVVNGAFDLEFRRIRDRIRLVKNPTYWNAANVKLNVVDVLAIQSEQTALNMYLAGKADWVPAVPTYVIPDLLKRDDFKPTASLIVYFYRINTTREALKDKRVRQALSMALDRRDVLKITQAGEVPAFGIVPPGMAGYTSPPTRGFDVEAAQKLLADAGYPDGRGMPRLEILYNNNDAHRVIAEVVQDQWKRNLGIQVDLKNQEWASYQDAQRTLQYQVARAGWIGDYADPMTFLDLWQSNNPNNETGWKNPEYDKLLKAALEEPDAAKRLEILRQAEAIFVEELPAIPMYFYVDKNLVRTYVKGFEHNLLDMHPLDAISIDLEEKARVFKAEGLK